MLKYPIAESLQNHEKYSEGGGMEAGIWYLMVPEPEGMKTISSRFFPGI